MPHINTEPGGNDLTSSAYIVRLDTNEPSLVLHRHKILKQYLQFGGHVEKRENLWDTVVHEIVDESGYAISQLRLLQPVLRIKKLTNAISHPVPVNILTHEFEGMDEHSHTDIAFGFTAKGPPQNNVAKGESKEIELFTPSELRALPPEEIPESVREVGLFVLEQCLMNWESVDPPM